MKSFLVFFALIFGLFGFHFESLANSSSRQTQKRVIRTSTQFDYEGYQRFKSQNTPGDLATEKFLQEYGGSFPEERTHIKVNGSLEIHSHAQVIALKFGQNVFLTPEDITPVATCAVDFEAKIEEVRVGDYGFLIAIRADSISESERLCLLTRVDSQGISQQDDLMILAFNYINSSTLHLSLLDAEVYFEKDLLP